MEVLKSVSIVVFVYVLFTGAESSPKRFRRQDVMITTELPDTDALGTTQSDINMPAIVPDIINTNPNFETPDPDFETPDTDEASVFAGNNAGVVSDPESLSDDTGTDDISSPDDNSASSPDVDSTFGQLSNKKVADPGSTDIDSASLDPCDDTCVTMTDCNQGEMCSNGCCAPFLPLQSSLCVNPCTNIFDCGLGEKCSNGCCTAMPVIAFSPIGQQCADPCMSGANCDFGKECNNGCCVDMPVFPSNPFDQQCDDPCMSGANCDSDETCIDGCCVENSESSDCENDCNTHWDCGRRERCSFGCCVPRRRRVG